MTAKEGINMNRGKFEIEVNNSKILQIGEKILKEEQFRKIFQICEQYGTEEDEVRKYDVYRIETDSGNKILKKTNQREMLNYEKYLDKQSFHVPAYNGKYIDDQSIWILCEYITGNDLREMTNQYAISAADSLSAIQNQYWNCTDNERFRIYWERINQRYEYTKNVPVLMKAYELFLQRQKNCPRTLSNGDFLAWNAIANEDIVYLIDWGFGGIMPYSLDIARFIAHGTENKATFPFTMNQEQKRLFVQKMYEKLNHKLEYEQFILDIKLALLNEYIEFAEAGEDENHWYFEHALKLAEDILNERAQ